MAAGSAMTSAKVALVHDYLVERGGAEKVLAALHEVFPDAPIYTAVYNADTTLDVFHRAGVRTSFLQRLTRRRERYRTLLPLYPLAFRSFDLRAYDRLRHEATRDKFRLNRIIQRIVAWPELANVVAGRLRRRPALADRLVAIAGDFVPARTAFDLGFLLDLLTA